MYICIQKKNICINNLTFFFYALRAKNNRRLLRVYSLFNSVCRTQIIIIDYSKQSVITLKFQKAVLITYLFAVVSVRHIKYRWQWYFLNTTQYIVVVCGLSISAPRLNTYTERALELNYRSAISIRFSQGVVESQIKKYYFYFFC